MSNQEYIEKMRHTLSHVLAAAVKDLFGTTTTLKFGIGPAVENGFYYDIDFGGLAILEESLPEIEKKMRGIIQRKLPVEREVKTKEEALAWAKAEGQSYKEELIRELPEGEEISFYTVGDFTDLCRGPHLDNTSEVGAFKLMRVSGAYWKGDEKREQMTRIFGVAFETEEELKNYLTMMEEARKRDHRKLGKELDLFCFSDLVGSGLPMFTPRGTILREMLSEFAQGYRERCGYQKVWIPHIANLELYKVSGHYEKFPELLKFVSEESGDELALKPVSCPHHSQIFASVPRSYKDLPVKFLETTQVYRDERKGELGGLSRVRAISQDDSHVFCTEDQVEGVFGELIEAAKDLYARIDMELKLRLSFRDDKDAYIGDEKMWEQAEASIQKMADKFKMNYEVGVGEAAMYGPKMDFMAVDALGREWQLATVQLDYALPSRFGLEYTDKDGSKKVPIMVHCALIGSIERFLSIFIEHTGGWFPFWCAPEQVRVLTINDAVTDYVAEVEKELHGVSLDDPVEHNKLRYTVDARNESLGKKIKEAVTMKIPAVLIVGPKDAEAREVSVRLKDEEQKVKLEDLAEFMAGLNK